MVYELTNEEKISIIDQHLKNLEYNRYNLEISLIELTSATLTKEESIENLQSEIDSLVAQQNALNTERQSLQG
jgi:chromosome segregation ATPase